MSAGKPSDTTFTETPLFAAAMRAQSTSFPLSSERNSKVERMTRSLACSIILRRSSRASSLSSITHARSHDSSLE